MAAERAPAQDQKFLRLSQALTGHSALSSLTADRIADGFKRVEPELYAQFGALGALVRPGATPSEILASGSAAGLKDAALAIVAAWYTGTIGKGAKAVTVSYADALMQRPAADGLAPPTYVLGGPSWWASSPPDIGVSPPVQQAPANSGTTHL
jgi:fructose 5-dehydrogenase small subunit